MIHKVFGDYTTNNHDLKLVKWINKNKYIIKLRPKKNGHL